MRPRVKWAVAVASAIVLFGGAGVYAATAFEDHQRRANTPSGLDEVALDSVDPGDIVFRSTAPGDSYGLLGSVSAADPTGRRAVSDLACDRVDATEELVSCLRTERGVTTSFRWFVYDDALSEQWSAPLPGIPSRTRIADDSSAWVSTVFVTGHTYGASGFSTATVIHGADGTDYGNLEDFAFTVNGDPVAAADRNFWGVTFVPRTTSFYATAASGGRTWLVRGDLADRTLVAIHDGVECPSLSPDGTTIAYKKAVDGSSPTTWVPAVLDLASGRETVLPDDRPLDDQIEWLDDTTIIYGIAREDAPGDSDVWSIAADGSSAPELLIEHAWSPSVVSGGAR